MLEASDIVLNLASRSLLANINLSLSPGQRLALLGASGAGKTTLLRVLSGVARPDSGRVLCNGVERIWRAAQIRLEERQVGWCWPRVTLVFQELHLFPNLTGEENILIGLAKDALAGALQDAQSLANRLGLHDQLSRLPGRLSQGERQRIAVIRALVRYPDYLLLDEPTSALDPFSRRALADVINEFSRDHNSGVLVATHDWEFASLVAQSFLTLKDGIVHCGANLEEAVKVLSSSK